ncbi:MAG: IS701 family transposase [Alphaproteobacteria bacterium]|nr:IS701 family transposase [Alphaproteobacteria bacterium]
MSYDRGTESDGSLPMSLLDHPQAQALLADAVLTPEAVRGCQDRLTDFLRRYLPRFRRIEQRANVVLVLRGLLSGLQRKTCEPIAVEAGVHRKPIQFLVGAGKWDDEAVMAELRRHVAEELADERAVLVLDATTFPKSGDDSCGVGRQWCGRLGKQENCQRGIFLAYAARGGYAPLDRQLYLPKDWADDPTRRTKTHVPEAIVFREGWRIAADLIRRCGPDLPHRWVTGDDEFGRPAQFRAWLRGEGERYVLDVPCDTIVRDREQDPPARQGGRGRGRVVPWCRVDAWVARQPETRWTRLTVRQGEKGPLRVDAMTVRVRTKLEQRIGPEERLVVMRTVEAEPRIHYALSNASAEEPLEELVRARFERHRIEEVFESAKQETGLGHYEVRSWVGWHHHVTLSLLALWFLGCERRRLGGKNPGDHGVAGARGVHSPATQSGSECGSDRVGDHAGASSQGVGSDLSLVPGDQVVPAPPRSPRYQLKTCSFP